MAFVRPQIKIGATHVGTYFGGVITAVAVLSQNKIDVYAVFDQLNTIVADLTKLAGLLLSLATAVYAIRGGGTDKRLAEMADDPEFKGAVVSPELAAAVTSDKVQASVAELPPAAKIVN